MDGRGHPSLWSSEEYSFYFKLVFGDDDQAQQRYIADVLSPDKLSLNIGHRILAALLAMAQARIIFTTNFDPVIESAYALVAEKSLSSFHLEGSYAALDALNAEQFPLYGKLHGDFRYRSIKNFSEDLLKGDTEITKCFLAASSRYGLIVSGYSGRDTSVMAMFQSALEQNNPFPNGLFWATPKIAEVSASVNNLIDFAQAKGVRAHLVETGTFDELLSKIWRQLPDKPAAFDAKVKSASAMPVSIPLPPHGTLYPLLRMNGLPVIKAPKRCGIVNYADSVTFSELKDRVFQNGCDATITYTDKILFWGANSEIHKIFDKDKIKAIEEFEFDDPVRLISESTFLKAFFEESLCKTICANKPVLLRKKDKTYFAVVRREEATSDFYLPLRQALAYQGRPSTIAGTVPGLQGSTWAEAVSVKLEERNGALWVLLRPDIWISPLSSRQEATEFLRNKRRYRYNPQANSILDAWIRILLGSFGEAASTEITGFEGADCRPTFEIGSRTGYSRRVGGHG